MPSIPTNKFQFVPPQRREHLIEKFGGDERANGLPCPMLSTLVTEGMLTPDGNGEVSLDQLKSALDAVGISRLGQAVLAHGGAKATESLERGVLNLLKLETSDLEHRGSMGPLQDGGFRPEFLEQLKSFSSDGETLTLDDIAAAQKTRFIQDDPGLRGALLGLTELSAIFLVLGRPNADGTKALKLADVDRLYRENKLPEDFKAESVNLLAVGWNALKLAWKQNIGSAGARAEKGLREALSERSPVDTTSMLGLGAMCPAGMRPKAGAGATPGDVAQLHATLQNDVTDGDDAAQQS
jgi:hypothetical protein